MADLTLSGKNNQKKKSSIFASGAFSTSATMNESLFNLPLASLVTAAYAIVTTASGTATDTVDIKVGSTVIANEVEVGATGVAVDSAFAPVYFATGGTVSVVAGADAPDAAGVIKIVVEYIETENTNGEYTV